MLAAISRQFQALLLALQFLTVFPAPKNLAYDAPLQGLSLLWYPAVGLLVGLLLMLVCSVLPLPFYLQAALTVTVWIVLTGGLHLDGLADCADAWAGGLGDRERTLQLLKDPLCGSMGVIALMVVVILKTLALAAVIQAQQLCWLWVIPLVARLSVLLLFLTLNYVRPQGLGAILAQHFSRAGALSVLLGSAVLLLFVLPLDIWSAFALLLAGVYLTVRWAAMRRIGGFTGDVAGAQIEMVEVGLLLVLASRGAI